MQSASSFSRRFRTRGNSGGLKHRRVCRVVGAGLKSSQEESNESETVPSQHREESTQRDSVADKVHTILASKGLTLYRVSQKSAELSGRSSPYFLPHNLYYDLRGEGFSPCLHQLVTLSRVSGYRLRDWLRIFGFDLENITRLQVSLPVKRTILLDASLTDPNEWVTWVRNRELHTPIPPIAPLAQLLEVMPPLQIGSLSKPKRPFLYAKIGREDAMAFPELVPGSIVRINPQIDADLLRQETTAISDRLFLIEHGKGLCCCRVRFLRDNVIVLFDSGSSYGQVELRSPSRQKFGALLILNSGRCCTSRSRRSREIWHADGSRSLFPNCRASGNFSEQCVGDRTFLLARRLK